MEIPKQLQKPEINFVLIESKGKIPIEKEWTKKEHKYDLVALNRHINYLDGNYGVMGGGSKNLIIIDFDDEDVQNEIIGKLPKTFTVKSGGKGLLHKYFFSDQAKSFKILDEEENTLIDLQGEGKQCVGPGSIHPSGNKYEIVDESEIGYIMYADLQNILMPYNKKAKSEDNKELGELTKKIANKVDFKKLLISYGLTEKNGNYNCPHHKSEGGMCLGINKEKGIFNCFHCGRSGNLIKFVADMEDITIKQSIDKLKKLGNIDQDQSEITDQSDSKFLFNEFGRFTDFLKISKAFVQSQPVYYDKYKIWWLWNIKDLRWEQVDETDLLIAIDEKTQSPSVNSTIKYEILEALKRTGRKNKPLEAKKTWVQFKDTIVDIETDETFKASPKYFVTNPIPWKIGESEETPNMDKIFKEWVYKEGVQDESYVKTLYEIMAYCLLPSMPIHRMFCFIGDGLNGKGTFLRLVENLVGEDNKCATEMELLSSNRFESSKLYKKLVCFVGEIDKGIFKKTKTLKSLSGDDLIRFESKGKNGFDGHNYAKPLIATNHLPETSDKKKGFYRRWTIIDFLNIFDEKKDILADIPDIEYENFCLKSIQILKDLIKAGEFTNDGTIQDREEKYESHSNYITEFVNTYFIKGLDYYIEFGDFCDRYNEYLIGEGLKRKSKIEIGRGLILKGYEKKVKAIKNELGNTTTSMCILDIKLKEDYKNI